MDHQNVHEDNSSKNIFLNENELSCNNENNDSYKKLQIDVQVTETKNCSCSCDVSHGNLCQEKCSSENVTELCSTSLLSNQVEIGTSETSVRENALGSEGTKVKELITETSNNSTSNVTNSNNETNNINNANTNVRDCTTYLPDGYSISLISSVWDDFKCEGGYNNFLKGCKWAPDGSCLLTSSEDKYLRLFDLPQELYSEKTWPNKTTLPDLKKSLHIKEGGLVYDFCWYPLMSSWDPVTSCLFCSAVGEPVHMWDAFTGQLRATYTAANYAEEVMSAYCLTASPDGENLFCGYKNKVFIHDIPSPLAKPTIFDIKVLAGQTGLVSTIAVNPVMPSLFAVGTYQKTVGLYSATENCAICVFSGHNGGLTHTLFSPDGSHLYTGSRQDSEIVCWDLRNPGKVLFSLCRKVTTHQRIYFDLTPDGKTLFSGNTDGNVSIWDLESKKAASPEEPLMPDDTFQAHNDCANGVSINRHFSVLATSSGQRHFPEVINHDSGSSSSEEVDDEMSDSSYFFDFDCVNKKKENSVKLWWVGPIK